MRRTAVAVTGAVVMSLALLTLASCGDDAEVLVGSGTALEGEQSTIQLPHGRLTFVVTPARPVDPDELDDSDAEPDGDHVGVSWEWEPRAGVPAKVAGLTLADDVPAEIGIEIDGTDHALGPAYSTREATAVAGARFVPVDGDADPADVVVSVTFDGVTQTVRGDGSGLKAGAADALYSLPQGSSPAACDVALTPATVTGSPSCEASTVRLPYVDELGWAGEGSSWLAVSVVVTLTSYAQGGDESTVQKQTEELTLEGKPADRVVDQTQAGAQLTTLSVFGAPESSQSLELTRSVLPATSAGEKVAVTGTVTEQP